MTERHLRLVPQPEEELTFMPTPAHRMMVNHPAGNRRRMKLTCNGRQHGKLTFLVFDAESGLLRGVLKVTDRWFWGRH